MAVLELRSLTKRFGNVAAVDDATLTIDHGMLACLLGPSGCGKTTTLWLIAGFADLDAVQVERNGCERLFQRLSEELASNIRVADAIECSDMTALINWKRQGWLAPFVPTDCPFLADHRSGWLKTPPPRLHPKGPFRRPRGSGGPGPPFFTFPGFPLSRERRFHSVGSSFSLWLLSTQQAAAIRASRAADRG